MSDDSLIPDNLRQMLGKESAAAVTEVEKGAIRKFAEAMGDPNPLFTDEEAASEVGGILAPPTFFTTIRAGGLPEPEFHFGRVSVAAGREVELLKPIRPGQRLTATSKYANAYERQGRKGHILFYVIEITVRDEQEETVAVVRRTMARAE